MRYLLFPAALFFSIVTLAQAPVKTVPGDFTHDISRAGAMFQPHIIFSSAGNTVTLSNLGNWFTIIDLNTGATVRVHRDMSNISPDHRYLYDNYLAEETGAKGNMAYGWKIGWDHVLSDTMSSYVFGPYYAFGLDEKANLIGCMTEFHAIGSIKLMRGLYYLDTVTGKPLETLRPATDTLFVCKDQICGSPPDSWLAKNYLLVAGRNSSGPIKVLPLGKGKIITINENRYHELYTDSSFIYIMLDSRQDKTIKAYDAFTGKLLGTKSYPYTDRFELSFSFSGNCIYYFNHKEGKVYEDKVAKDTIITARTWDVRTELNLSKDQEWTFTATTGPSLFFVPMSVARAEDGGPAANAATLFNTVTGRIDLRIYPFFNQSPGEIAIQEKVMKEQKEFLDKLARTNRSLNSCEAKWNIPGIKHGLTVRWRTQYVILMSFDCKEDQYTIWKPSQWNEDHMVIARDVGYIVKGAEFRRIIRPAGRQYKTCTACGGDGSTLTTSFTAKPNELPWSYFAEVATYGRPFSTTKSEFHCNTCSGTGVVLK